MGVGVLHTGIETASECTTVSPLTSWKVTRYRVVRSHAHARLCPRMRAALGSSFL
jgi:hypothetical protein